jgi:plastocyanin
MKRTFGVVLALALVLVITFSGDANAAKKPKITVTLQEFTMLVLPSAETKAGTVRMKVINKGSLTHEMVVVRAASVTALPKVTTGGGARMVGAVDEEAIPEPNKMGETGDVKPGKAVTKTFKLRPGRYVMFCNIDDASGNHFAHAMYAEFVVTK